MNIKHLNNAELTSLVGNGNADTYSKDNLLILVDELIDRLDQSAVDNQDAIDDIANVLDEFESAYATVSHEIDSELSDEYNDELKALKLIIRESE